MPIKMIVMDLDRTLLKRDKIISDFTANVLSQCSSLGIKIIFATARPKNRVDILSLTHLSDGIITDNGSLVYIGDKIVDSSRIPYKTAEPFMKKLVDALPGVRISIEYPNLKVANYNRSDLWHAKIRNDIGHPLDIPATKIVVEAGREIFDNICNLLPNNLYAQLCEDRLILIMHRDATKWKAIQFVAKYFGFSTTDIVAFGDDYNDLQMLQYCGIGIAVENALKDAKAIADYVCCSNDEDGVAMWLNKNILYSS